MKYECCASLVYTEDHQPGMTQEKDYSIGTGNDRGRIGTPTEVADRNKTTAQAVAEAGLVMRHPL